MSEQGHNPFASDYEVGRLYKARTKDTRGRDEETLIATDRRVTGYPWNRLNGQNVAAGEVTDVRGPLVVLDLGHTPLPEDRLGRSEAQLLVSTLRESADEFFEPNAAYLNRKVADQIEEQIKPPRPPEPKGLGAVVKDRKGKRYSRHTTGTLAPWIVDDPADKDRPYRYYSDLDVPDADHILSWGVQ